MNRSLAVADETYAAFHEGTDVEVVGLVFRWDKRLENVW